MSVAINLFKSKLLTKWREWGKVRVNATKN